MKKAALITLLVIIIIGGWFLFHQKSVPGTVTNIPTTTVTHPNLTNATFTFDSSPVTLKNGQNIAPAAPDSAEMVETDLTSDLGYGDLNGDGKEDAAAILTQSGAGSGTFVYIAAYVSGPVAYKGTNTVFIGDRIEPQSVSVRKGYVTVTYLDRKPDEPLSADPTVPTTATFQFSSLDNSLTQQ